VTAIASQLREEAERREAPAPWLIPLMLAVFAAGVPIDNLLVRSFGTSSVIGVPLVVAAGWQALTTGRLRAPSPPLLWLSAFAAWSLLSVLWAEDVARLDVHVKTRLQLLLLVWLCWQVARSPRCIRALLYGYVAGCVVDVVDSWRVYRAGGLLAGYARYYAEGFNPNHLAVTLALGIPMASYLATTGTRRANVALLYVPVALGGIALGGSRTGMLTAAAATSGIVLWIMGRSRAALAWIVALVVAGVVGVAAWIPEETWSRLFTVRAEIETGSLGSRGAIWSTGLTVFADNPVLGVGIGSFGRMVAPALGVAAVAHNTPLSVASETGLVGLLLFLAVPASLVWTGRAGARNERAFVLVLLLAWAVGTFAGTWEEDKQTWFVFLACAAVAARREAQRERAPAG
jgi:O-antigen ligase